MPAFTNEQWVVIGLVFVLGVVVGMILRGGGKWKAAYYAEVRKREALEVENRRLAKDSAEMDSLTGLTDAPSASAARNP